MLTATSYRSLYAFGNHYRIASVEEGLTTCDSGVACAYQWLCKIRLSDPNPVMANMEYVGEIEGILELNYCRHCIVVLVCNHVKANYQGENTIIRKDKWGFSLADFEQKLGCCKESFTFSKHCKQVFFLNSHKLPSWKVVLRNEVCGRREWRSANVCYGT
jgi:hypothetical protein